MDVASDLSTHSVRDLAVAVVESWERPYFGAKPYITAMLSLDAITDQYGVETGVDVVNYFLANAQSWRGPVARAIKAELRRRLERAYH